MRPIYEVIKMFEMPASQRDPWLRDRLAKIDRLEQDRLNPPPQTSYQELLRRQQEREGQPVQDTGGPSSYEQLYRRQQERKARGENPQLEGEESIEEPIEEPIEGIDEDEIAELEAQYPQIPD